MTRVRYDASLFDDEPAQAAPVAGARPGRVKFDESLFESPDFSNVQSGVASSANADAGPRRADFGNVRSNSAANIMGPEEEPWNTHPRLNRPVSITADDPDYWGTTGALARANMEQSIGGAIRAVGEAPEAARERLDRRFTNPDALNENLTPTARLNAAAEYLNPFGVINDTAQDLAALASGALTPEQFQRASDIGAGIAESGTIRRAERPFAERIPDDLLDDPGKSIKAIGQQAMASLPVTGLALAASRVSPAAGNAVMGTLAGGSGYQQAAEEGLSPADRQGKAGQVAVTEILTEKLPFDIALGRAGKAMEGMFGKRVADAVQNNIGARMAATGATEVSQEMLAEVADISYDATMHGTGVSLDEFKRRVRDAGLTGGLIGAGMGGTGYVLQRPKQQVHTGDPQADAGAKAAADALRRKLDAAEAELAVTAAAAPAPTVEATEAPTAAVQPSAAQTAPAPAKAATAAPAPAVEAIESASAAAQQPAVQPATGPQALLVRAARKAFDQRARVALDAARSAAGDPQAPLGEAETQAIVDATAAEFEVDAADILRNRNAGANPPTAAPATGAAAQGDNRGDLSKLSKATLMLAGDMPHGQGRPIGQFPTADAEILEAAGLVEEVENEDGSVSRVVYRSAFDGERERRSQDRQKASPEEIKRAVEQRAKNYERVAAEKDEAGYPEEGDALRAKAAEIRRKLEESSAAPAEQPVVPQSARAQQPAPAPAPAPKPAQAPPSKRRDPRQYPEDYGLPPRSSGLYDDLLDFAAANGGLDRDAWAAEGVDPATWGQREKRRHDPGRSRSQAVRARQNNMRRGQPIFRRRGGMTPDQFREKAQEAGYFPAEDPNAPPTLDANDVLQAVMGSLNQGERHLTLEGQGYDRQIEGIERQRDDELRQEQLDASDAALAAEVGLTPDELKARVSAEYTPDMLPAELGTLSGQDVADALTYTELVDRAIAHGATDEDIDAASIPFDGEGNTESQIARNLWRLIDNLQGRTNADDQGTAQEDAGGVPQAGERAQQSVPAGLQPAEGGPGQAEAPLRSARGADLFAAPTTGEEVRAKSEAVDERLRGSGTAATMRQGAGDLFAGPRPEQTRIPDAAPETTGELEVTMTEAGKAKAADTLLRIDAEVDGQKLVVTGRADRLIAQGQKRVANLRNLLNCVRN